MKMSEAKELILAVVKDNFAHGIKDPITPVLVGDPGLGKTSIVRQVAAELGVKESTLIVAQYDPAELGGFPFIDRDDDGQVVGRVRPRWMPKKDRGILTLDEIGQAMLAQQNLVAQLVEERRIGENRVSPNWAMVGCTNKLTNRAGVNEMPTHLKDRLLFVDVDADADEFLAYAASVGADPMIIGFIGYRPTMLHKFDPAQRSCPTPRSWMKVNRILGMDASVAVKERAIACTVGEGAAADMTAFMRIFSKLPRLEGIYTDPRGHFIPAQDKMTLYALSAALAGRATTSNIKATMTYLDRWDDQEFVAFAVRAIQARDKSLISDPSVRDWAARKGAALLA